MKLTRTCVIAAALVCSFNIMAASTQQLQRFSVMLTNDSNFISNEIKNVNLTGIWELNISASTGQGVTCNGGACPTSISPGQTISIEASSTDGYYPPSFGVTEVSPKYISDGWTCQFTAVYYINSPGKDMNAVLPMFVAILNPPNYSYVTTSTRCTPSH